MYVTVSISLAEGESVPAATPAEVLSALGGDPTKDSISVSVSASHAPPPPELPPVEPSTPVAAASANAS